MSYNVNPYLKAPNHAITVSVIGCGGTGSLLLTRLARINYALKQMDHPGLHVVAYDDDEVEEYNVGRQNFTPGDVGQNKAINMVSKCNMAYGTNWEAYTNKHCGLIDTNIAFICVDNVRFRMKVQNRGIKPIAKGTNMYYQPLYLFDCGNGKDFGQVVLSDLHDNKLKRTIDLFPEMPRQDNKKFQRTRGCSYAEKLQEQNLMINDFISNEAADLFWKLFTEPQLTVQGAVINQITLRKQPIKIKSDDN